MNKGGEKEIKVTITKNEINTESKGSKEGRLKISRSGRNIGQNADSTTEKKTTVKESSRGKGGKVETVTTKEVITQRNDSKNGEVGEGSGTKSNKGQKKLKYQQVLQEKMVDEVEVE